MSVSRSTVLRLVAVLPEPDVPAPRVVGVDRRPGTHSRSSRGLGARRPGAAPPRLLASSPPRLSLNVGRTASPTMGT
ncbi:hypothetical protein EF909_15585 [Streptomyces sp. WAC01280]|nr:hypothetical protein EF909_15585 [Streptomyces sp. WAC01280]